MRKPPRPSEKNAKRQLSAEDEALWASLSANLKPLARAKGRVSRVQSEARSEGSAPERVKQDERAAHRGPHPSATDAKQARQHTAGALDRNIERSLKHGKINIDARIDLHGMRQAEAHRALRRFLIASHDAGRRMVLVITGKGSPAPSAEERGVLKRNVPVWLADPEMSAIVVGFTGAALRHGGEGALYVHLRNPGRIRRP